MMTTLLRRHPEQYLQKSHFTHYSQYFRDVEPSFIVTKPTAFCENSNLGGGEAVSGMMTTLFCGHPEQYLYTLARTPNTHYFKSKPSYFGVWALGVLASPIHVQLAQLFLMFMRCCASGFRRVETLLTAPVFCTVFAAFSYYPTTCGVAVSSTSSLKNTCGRCMLPNNSLSPNNALSDHTSALPPNEEENAVAAWSKTPVLNTKTIVSGTGEGPRKGLQQHHSAIRACEES